MFVDENSTLIRLSIQWLHPAGTGLLPTCISTISSPIPQNPFTAAFDKGASENQLAFSLNDHKPWAIKHAFCRLALFLMFAPGVRNTDTALSTIAAVTSTNRSWPD